MSTISAGTTLTTALISAGDTTGDLQLQVNGTTPALTLKADGSIGLGATPTYGTAGQVFTSNGTGAAATWEDAYVAPATPNSLGSIYGESDSLGNTSIGYNALASSATTNRNTAVGANCFRVASGYENTGLGYKAGGAGSSTGAYNVAIGSYAGYSLAGTSNNVMIGYNSGYYTTTGNSNTFVGDEAGRDVTTGGYNIVIGRGAGTGSTNLTTGSNNILIGQVAEPSATGVSNEITIGNASNDSLRLPGLQVGKSAGDVLTFDGSKITLATPSAGAMTLISSATASNSASISFTSLDWTTYKNYMVIIDQAIPSINGTFLATRTSTNNGSSYDNGSADYVSGGILYGGGSVNNFGSSGASQSTGYLTDSVFSTTAYGGASLNMIMFNMASSTYPTIKYEGYQSNTSYGFVAVSGFAQRYNSTTTVNAIQFFFSSGNIVSGTFKLYGIS